MIYPVMPFRSKPIRVVKERQQTQHFLPPALRFGATLLEDYSAVVDFSGSVTEESMNALGRKIQKMVAEKRSKRKKGTIKLLINSPGGNISDGFKLCGIIRQLNFPVDTIVMGEAASMGVAIMLDAATSGRRFMDRYAKLMIHQPSLSDFSGTAAEMINSSKELQQTRDILDSLISRKTGLPLNKVRRMTNKDFYITPLQALKYGFVDWVLMDGKQGLNRDSIQHLSDREIQRRDQLNQYDDLPMFTIDPMSSQSQQALLKKTKAQKAAKKKSKPHFAGENISLAFHQVTHNRLKQTSS